MLNRLQGVFASLNSHEVKYLVIGGTAAILYGVPRATFDLDLLVEATLDNAQRLLSALQAAGFGTAVMTTPEELLSHEITVFKDVYRIDVQTRTPGIVFPEAWERRQEMSFQGTPFLVARLEDIIASKKAAGRSIRRLS